MNSIHSIGKHENHQYFFGKKNLDFLKEKIRSMIQKEYNKIVNVDDPSLLRVCQRVIEERLEIWPRMNERVVMYLTNEIRNYLEDTQKHLTWQEKFVSSQSLWDSDSCKGYYIANKGRPRLFNKGERVGGTLQFIFMY